VVKEDMFSGKPVIGIAGGIGAGKSLVAKAFGDLGCLVISADELVRLSYQDPKVKQTLRKWWGDLVFGPDGEIDRPAVARKIFTLPDERKRLEQLIHPMVNQARERIMKGGADDPQVVAFVWDTPLLFEVGLNAHCDAVVFVDAPRELRHARLAATRGWDAAELDSRENSQMPLDRKAEISDHRIVNAAGVDEVHAQVREVLSRILADSGSKKLSSDEHLA
jgi:dephospho-CoA kinase